MIDFKEKKTTWRRIFEMAPLPQPSLIKTKYPVVLMHGFGALGGISSEGHLHDEAMYLRHYGVWAYAPNVSPYSTIEVRSNYWIERLQFILDETGAEKLNLVAHSMGGLDARYLVHHLNGFEFIASVSTVATPHFGTSVAQKALDQREGVKKWLAQLMNRIGMATKITESPDFLAAVRSLTPAYLEDTFNPKTPDHPDVEYFSWAARAGKGTDVKIHPALAIPNRLIFNAEGENDGLVPVESAKWTGFQGTIDACHARQVGVQLKKGEFRSTEFFAYVCRFLAEKGL